jgi:hypothetical protein
MEAPAECPIINTTPDDLEDVMLWIFRNRAKLGLIREQRRRYVQMWHAIPAVAARFGELYQQTTDFPPRVRSQIEGFREREDKRRNSIQIVDGWQHPFQVEKQSSPEKLNVMPMSGS